MKAIVTKYHPVGLVRSDRYSATDNDGNRAYVSNLTDLSVDDNHLAAMRALCVKMGWQGTLVRGALVGVGQVWVWRESKGHIATEVVIGGAK